MYNDSNKLNALGVFIFGGSATFGVEAAGFNVQGILEMTNNMLDLNAYHFHKNRPDVDIILPKEWESDEYLIKLQAKSYDLLYANCPCSSLSRINRSASVDGPANVHFYRVFDTIERVQPKVFFIENAPALVKMGYPILENMVERLGHSYKFTIVRDVASNHGVAMKRMRTLILGWRRDVFDDKIPLVHMNVQVPTTVRDVIGDLNDIPLGSFPNHDLVEGRDWAKYDFLLNYVGYDTTFMQAMIANWDEVKHHFAEDPNYKGMIERTAAKIEANKGIWDKSPRRPRWTDCAQSITSITHNIHPEQNRQWTIREYARLMGYPDEFVFYPGENQTPIIQCIAQGVPKYFVKYITGEAMEALKGNRELKEYDDDEVLVFQHHTYGAYRPFTLDELHNIEELEYYPSDKNFQKLDK